MAMVKMRERTAPRSLRKQAGESISFDSPSLPSRVKALKDYSGSGLLTPSHPPPSLPTLSAVADRDSSKLQLRGSVGFPPTSLGPKPGSPGWRIGASSSSQARLEFNALLSPNAAFKGVFRRFNDRNSIRRLLKLIRSAPAGNDHVASLRLLL